MIGAALRAQGGGQPEQVAREPAHPDADAVRAGRRQRGARRPPVEQEREVDAAPHGDLDRGREAWVDLHQHRAPGAVAPELDLGEAAVADRLEQALGVVGGVPRQRDALAQHRGSAEHREHAVRHLREAGRDPAVVAEQQPHRLAGARHVLLEHELRPGRERPPGRRARLGDGAGELRGEPDATVAPLHPGARGLEHGGQADLGERGRQVVLRAHRQAPGHDEPEAGGDGERALLVDRDRHRRLRRERESGVLLQRGAVLPQDLDGAVVRRDQHRGGVELEQAVEREAVAGRPLGRVGNERGHRRVPGGEGGRPVVALEGADPEPGAAERADRDEALPVRGVEHRRVEPAEHGHGHGSDPRTDRPRPGEPVTRPREISSPSEEQ